MKTCAVLTVGYCASCRFLTRHADERPVMTLARYGWCRLGVVPIHGCYGMCNKYQPTPARK